MEQKKILVAIDGSEHSEKILDVAVEYSRLLNGIIYLVHCHKRFPTIKGEPYLNEEISNIISETENLMRPYLQRLGDEGLRVEERMMEEPAGRIISEVASIEGCDLIVMGSRGLTNLASLIIGSVTNRVLQTAPCSVLVVR